MSATPASPHPPGATTFESLGSVLAEFTDADPGVSLPPPGWTPQSLLHAMRARVKYYGSPLPEGFVPPPGIDIHELLKQVPWPPPTA